jgi:DNA-binding transcriptional regulator GbsR (MarR family)
MQRTLTGNNVETRREFILNKSETKVFKIFYYNQGYLSISDIDNLLNKSISNMSILRAINEMLFFGLIELNPKKSGKTGRKNLYRLTQKGEEFYDKV